VFAVPDDDDIDIDDEAMEELEPIDGADFEGDLEDAEFDGDIDLEDLTEDDVLGEDDDVLGDDDDLADDALVDVLEVEEEPAAVRPKAPDDEEEDDDEQDPDDVEASLDDILKDRLVIEEVEVDDDDEQPDVDDRSSETSVVIPKRPDEFVCQLCFLVKHPSQLADKTSQLCRDCV
jgi:Domain of unknown function (DUF4193)